MIELAAVHGSTYAVANAANIAPKTLYAWYKTHEGFKDEMEAAFETFVDNMASTALEILSNQLTKMKAGQVDFDLPTILRTLTRKDRRWSQTYRQQDVSVQAQPAIAAALEELESESRRMDASRSAPTAS